MFRNWILVMVVPPYKFSKTLHCTLTVGEFYGMLISIKLLKSTFDALEIQKKTKPKSPPIPRCWTYIWVFNAVCGWDSEFQFYPVTFLRSETSQFWGDPVLSVPWMFWLHLLGNTHLLFAARNLHMSHTVSCVCFFPAARYKLSPSSDWPTQ